MLGVKVSGFGVLVLSQTRQRQGAKNGLFCLPSNSRQAQLLGGVSAVGKSKVGKRAAKHRFGVQGTYSNLSDRIFRFSATY